MDNTAATSPSRKRHEEGGGGRGRNNKKPRGRGNSNNGGGGRGRSRGGRGGGGGRGGSGSNNNKNNISPPPGSDAFVPRAQLSEPQAVQDDSPVNQMESSSTQEVATRNQHQFSNTRFVDQDDKMISQASKRALTEVLKYEYMTKVQEATLPTISAGVDVVAKAKTGSGKTTAFLLPIIERLVTTNSNNNKIVAVVLSPTRELANQISVEFTKLATFQPRNVPKCHITMIGGTSLDKDRKRLEQDQSIQLVIATPGRLQDHLKKNTAGIVERLSEVDVFCFDEADRLLDSGFRNDIEDILKYVPRVHRRTGRERQTLLFSATFPPVMKDITDLAMRKDYQFIDTLDEDEGETNVQVVQKFMITPLIEHILAMEHILQDHINERKKQGLNFKVIVFFTTARVAGYMAELFRADPRYPHYNDKTLLEMHSRKSQSYRTNVANTFTKTRTNILLFSSDVSARGVDYPDVTCVLQVGAPSEKAQYVHRLGRTARAGMSGVGYLLLSDFERAFMSEVSDLDITPMDDLMSITEEEAQQEQEHFQHMLQKDQSLLNSAKAAYQAFLGYYNSNIRRLKIRGGKDELVTIANEYATIIGFPEGQPPALQAKTVGKMGLKGVQGLIIERDSGGGHGGRGGGGRGGGGGGRGGEGGGHGGRGRGRGDGGRDRR